MTTKLLEALEIKVAFLEDSHSKLSDEFYVQQRELEELKAKYARLIDKMRSSQSDDSTAFEASDERPPHY